MKRLTLTLAALLCTAGLAAADPIEGLWKTAPDDHGDTGLIKVAQCGGSYCGTLIRAFDKSGAETHPDTIGRKIVWDVKPDGGDSYTGRIYAPDRDKEYASKLELRGNQLAVSGCVLGGLICRSGGSWSRSQ